MTRPFFLNPLHLIPQWSAKPSSQDYFPGQQQASPKTNPPPVPNSNYPIWALVIEDMVARDKVGRQRYGVPLQGFNGRDALQDAYEEALDLVAYLRQAIYERDNVDNPYRNSL